METANRSVKSSGESGAMGGDRTRIRPRRFMAMNAMDLSKEMRIEIRKAYYAAMIDHLVRAGAICAYQGQQCLERMRRRYGS